MNEALEPLNLTGEIKTVRVFDHQMRQWRDVQVMAYVFVMDVEGTLTCVARTAQGHFSMPKELEGFFTQFSKRTVLWCTWEENGPTSAMPTAVPFDGALLPLK